MAQVADLQEESNPNPDAAGSADDVLSQLAGSEIDRLLAEADADSAVASAPLAPDAVESTEQKKITPDPREAAAVETELGLDEASLTSQLDELFNQLQQDTAPKPVKAAPPAPVEPAAQPTIAQAPPADIASPEAATAEGAERAALLEAAGFDANAASPESAAAPTPVVATEAKPETKVGVPAPAAPAPDPASSERSAVLDAAGFDTSPDADAPLPIWLKPLEWINAPVQHCSPAVRQAMGRAAIVTLVNAVLVLSYVAISHKH